MVDFNDEVEVKKFFITGFEEIKEEKNVDFNCFFNKDEEDEVVGFSPSKADKEEERVNIDINELNLFNEGCIIIDDEDKVEDDIKLDFIDVEIEVEFGVVDWECKIEVFNDVEIEVDFDVVDWECKTEVFNDVEIEVCFGIVDWEFKIEVFIVVEIEVDFDVVDCRIKFEVFSDVEIVVDFGIVDWEFKIEVFSDVEIEVVIGIVVFSKGFVKHIFSSSLKV